MQIVLLALTFMCALMYIIFHVVRFAFADAVSTDEVFKAFSETTNSTGDLFRIILFALIWGIGTYAAVSDKLNAKIALFMSIAFFGTSAVAQVGNVVNMYTLLGALDGDFAKEIVGLIWNLIFVFVYIRFFSSKKVVSPWPIYIINGVSCVDMIVSIVTTAIQEVPDGINRNFLNGITMLNLLGFLLTIFEYVLFAMLAYTLDKKRRLVAR